MDRWIEDLGGLRMNADQAYKNLKTACWKPTLPPLMIDWRVNHTPLTGDDRIRLQHLTVEYHTEKRRANRQAHRTRNRFAASGGAGADETATLYNRHQSTLLTTLPRGLRQLLEPRSIHELISADCVRAVVSIYCPRSSPRKQHDHRTFHPPTSASTALLNRLIC